MEGIKNFLVMVNAHYMDIIVCVGLVIGIVQKVKHVMAMSKEERVTIAKKQIQNTILKLVTDAELDFEDWNSAGEIKRANVIDEIYSYYPILDKVVDQDELIGWIDTQIDESLGKLKTAVANNKAQ